MICSDQTIMVKQKSTQLKIKEKKQELHTAA